MTYWTTFCHLWSDWTNFTSSSNSGRQRIWSLTCVWLSVFLLLFYLFMYVFIYVSIYLFIYVFIYLSIYWSMYLCIYLFMYLFIYSSIYLVIYLIIYLSIYLLIKCNKRDTEGRGVDCPWAAGPGGSGFHLDYVTPPTPLSDNQRWKWIFRDAAASQWSLSSC